jgi:outer membrane protein assembly factor BamA
MAANSSFVPVNLISKKYYLLIACLLHYALLAYSQSKDLPPAADTLFADTLHPSPAFIIGDITITGNRKTKSYIVERELTFKKGDSVYLPDLIIQFQQSKELLINTKLFNEAVISLKSFRGYTVDILVEVKERWYIFPIPYLKPIDRNLSAWADKGYQLDRINYGLKFTHYNFTGRDDKLRWWLITGYTRQIELSYDQPYADKNLKQGYGIGISYAARKEINVATVNNVQKFLKSDSLPNAGNFLEKSFYASFKYSYRPALRTVHTVVLGYLASTIDSAVAVANPNYYKEAALKFQYPELSYSLNYQNVDYIPYVLKGFMGDINFVKKGITPATNLWQLQGKFTKGWAVGWASYFGLQGGAIIKLPFKQAFVNQHALGYGDLYLRGLEKYVVDGEIAGLLRSTIRKQILDVKIPFRFSTSHSFLPLRLYLKTYADMGYVQNQYQRNNALVNQTLYTAGAGVDVVTLYDLVLRVEYSFNQFGENGLFLHVSNDF